MKSLYLVDSSIYIFRAYFSLPESLLDADGNPAHAVRGYASFLSQLRQKSGSDYYAFAFDESLTTSFRNEIYPDYKTHRELPPEHLARQLAACKQLTEILGFKTYAHPRFEADDLIGTLARKMRRKDFRMRFVTSDKDLAQLVRPGDHWWDFAKNEKRNRSQIKYHLGVWPEQVPDLLALMGDAVDNIPGIPGIGPKTAALLLGKFRRIEDVYDQLHKIADMDLRGAARVKMLLEQYHGQAMMSQQLARISENVPIRCSEASLRKKRSRRADVLAFCDQQNISGHLRNRLLVI